MAVTIDGTSGITAPAIDAVLDGADLTAGSVVQSKLETLVVPIGVGQTWTDVKASRASGVAYTNSTKTEFKKGCRVGAKWFNNGEYENLYIPGEQPDGFSKGRKPKCQK